jgi:hypothetical protein
MKKSRMKCGCSRRAAGLDMEFNSLDAQREACEAYITSQRSEGWVLVPDRYDDGGVSGGTLERPALRRMLADIERGRLDVVVCYKLDRLSRALMDFAKLVEVFDANSVTFVSVTQIFGSDGRAMSPTHARGRRGQQYRYYVSQSVLKGSAADGPAIARISAAEIEGVVIAQVRGLLRQPEVVLGAWRAARASAPDMTEDEARLALERLDPLWEELFPAERARIIRLLVDRVDIGPGDADVRLKLEGLASLARDLAPPAEAASAAA